MCTMAVRGTPAENAAKWKTRLSAATPEITAGIQRVQVAPGQAAARQQAAWLANTTASADKWARNTARVTLQSWQADALAGVNRVASGAQAKVGKVEAFLTEFQPHLDRVATTLAAMPRGGLEANLARMLVNARENAKFRRSGT